VLKRCGQPFEYKIIKFGGNMDSKIAFDGTTVLLSFILGIVGCGIGLWLGKCYEDRPIKRVREIAIKALKIFQKYAKQNKTFKEAYSEFNVNLNKTEQRAVLLCLYKIGIPITPLLNSEDLSFEFNDEAIKEAEIQSMMNQIKSGHCDTLFYQDIEPYFQNNLKIKALRKIAIRFVNEVFKNSRCKKNTEVNPPVWQTIYPDRWADNFTFTELTFIAVFKDKTNEESFFDQNLKSPKESKLKELIEEIEFGYWDSYFSYDYESYTNLREQIKLYTILNRQQNMQNPQAINQTNQTT
jgi:hypothetical protein